MTNKESPQRTVAIHTHGCKLNQADSQALARRFREAGYRVVGPSAAADVVVLNSCTVTAAADAKARQYLRTARRRNPGAVVVATGCYAQRAPADLDALPEVSLVIGNTGKTALVESVQNALEAQPLILDAPTRDTPTSSIPLPQRHSPESGNPNGLAGESLQHTHPNSLPEGEGTLSPPVLSLSKGEGRTRAMVKIQEGCDQVCAYCIVPKVRGRERSLPPEEIIAEIDRHCGEGYREVALTGTQLGTYGFDLSGVDLKRLLERILAESSVERLRVSSLQAHEITAPLLALWSDARLMPHFHIPLQSGCDTTLRAMRRRYSTSQFAASVELVRRMYPDAGITTDIIVGFPGESEEDFAASLEFASAMQFSGIHAFPYSPRPGTSAAHYSEKVSEPQKRARMGEMLRLAAESREDFRASQLGRVRQALWERASGSKGVWTGLTDNYLRVRTVSDSPLANQIANARLTGLEDDWILAELVGAKKRKSLSTA